MLYYVLCFIIILQQNFLAISSSHRARLEISRNVLKRLAKKSSDGWIQVNTDHAKFDLSSESCSNRIKMLNVGAGIYFFINTASFATYVCGGRSIFENFG